MSRFRKLSHTIWHCQYHIVWLPQYRHQILTGPIGNEIGNCIRSFSQQKEVEILEMNIQPDHVHVLAMVPPKISISDYCGTVKGRDYLNRYIKDDLKKLN
jgi:putative transposase